MNTQIAEQFLVHLLEPVAWDMQHEIAERLAVRLNVPLKRIEQTLSKGIGPMTRPLAHSEAQRIASAFSDMGLPVRVVADRSTPTRKKSINRRWIGTRTSLKPRIIWTPATADSASITLTVALKSLKNIALITQNWHHVSRICSRI
jgi:hypothetical protein